MAEILKPDFSNGLWSSGGANVAPSSVKIQTGWTSEVPPFQWENYLQNRQDQAIAHILQHGISQWDALTEYQANKSYVQGSDGKIYRSIQTNTGQNPVSDSSNIYWQVGFEAQGRLLRISVYTRDAGGSQLVAINGGSPSSVSASSFTPLSLTKTIKVKLQGAGAGSSGTWTCDANKLSAAGGGGGGAYAEAWYTGGFSGLAINIGIGGAGAAANSAAQASSGGSSSFGSLLTCPGGIGSINAPSASVVAGVVGGSGESPSATGSNIIVSIKGGPGLFGLQLAGLANAGYGGNGGSTPFGSGRAILGQGNAYAGQPGLNWGSGAAGAFTGASNAGQNGAKGADGIMIIEEYS